MVEIRLNIYDLTYYNKYLDFLGLGAYHTAICIDGVEYNYGGADSPEPGVYCTLPKTHEKYIFKNSVRLGIVNKSLKEVLS